MTETEQATTPETQGEATARATKKALIKVQNLLLQRRTWRYLRYLHTRAGFLRAPETRSVLVIGAGYGFAEVALAIEFPEVEFLLTDWSGATHDFAHARKLCEAFSLRNVRFAVLDILAPNLPEKYFDMVVSVEVLEHILEDATAARNIRRLARHHVFTLVPYGSATENATLKLRQRVYSTHEHFRVGYDVAAIECLFPGKGVTAGCYWAEHGMKFRDKLTRLTDSDILAKRSDLAREARADLVLREPTPGEAAGIWRLSEAADLGF